LFPDDDRRFLLWQARAEDSANLPPPPAPAAKPPPPIAAPAAPAKAPESTPKPREQQRFSRSDRNDDGIIHMAELLSPRRPIDAKLDKNSDGRLSFEEWAVTTIDKFNGADRDRSKSLTPREYATTAAPPPKKKSCSC
jgi:hypothetical protein